MENIYKAMSNLKENDLLFEMANIQPRTTGLKNQLYASFDGKHLYSHGPRIKVRTPNYSRGFPIIIDRRLNKVYPLNDKGEYDNLQKEDKDPVNEALPYIEKHIKEFITHWDGIIGDEQLRKTLKGEITLKDAIQDAKKNGIE